MNNYRKTIETLKTHLNQRLQTQSPPTKQRLLQEANETGNSTGAEIYRSIVGKIEGLEPSIFITINYNWNNTDQFDVENNHKLILSKLPKEVRRNGATKYLWVIEQHRAPDERGRTRYHSHLLIGGIDTVTDELLDSITNSINTAGVVASVVCKAVNNQEGVIDYCMKSLGWQNAPLHIDYERSSISWTK